MSSKIRVGLSKTGHVLSTANYLMLFQVLLQFYYGRTYAWYKDALPHGKSHLNMSGILHGCKNEVGLV